MANSIVSDDGNESIRSNDTSVNGQLPQLVSRIAPTPLLPNRPSIPAAPARTPSSNPISNTSSFGLSRGPSPLTLGLSDVVPLAVAFQEVCHACFRGADESQVQTRLIGDLMVSFPAGIVNVIANNVNPAPLQFRIKHSNALESLLPNKELISPLTAKGGSANGGNQDSTDTKVFEFDMKGLQDMLKEQSEQNPGASYFNIDILKYQVCQENRFFVQP